MKHREISCIFVAFFSEFPPMCLYVALWRRECEILRSSKRRWIAWNLYFQGRVGSNLKEQPLPEMNIQNLTLCLYGAFSWRENDILRRSKRRWKLQNLQFLGSRATFFFNVTISYEIQVGFHYCIICNVFVFDSAVYGNLNDFWR